MSESEPLLTSFHGDLFRRARQALVEAMPDLAVGADPNQPLTDVIEEIQELADRLRDEAAGELGPAISWSTANGTHDLQAEVLLQIDLDGFTLNDPYGAVDYVDWYDTAMARAAMAYRRECQWDFSPGESGIWLLSVAPYKSWGDSERTHFTGALNGFVVLHDRDDDGQHEEVAHLWVAGNWRRQGIATRLIRAALSRFPIRGVDAPTPKGRELFLAVAPSLL